MKIDKRKSVGENSRIYIHVERKRFLENFWNEYELCQKREAKNWEISVYNFWGVGGTGKTELLNDLYNGLVSKKGFRVIKAFDEKKSMLENMLSIRNILVKQYSVDFTLFDLVYCEYCKKTGRDLNDFEKKSLFSNKIVESIYPFLNIMPNINLLAAIPQALKPYEEELKEKFNDDSFRFTYYSYVELEKRLPQYFAEALQTFLLKSDKIITVIIDNIDWIKGEDKEVFNKWFLEKGALIQSIPNVLWVFASREKICNDFFSDKTVQNCNVEGFDIYETREYLERLHISEEYLEDIFAITQGMPLYLELCKETYFACIKNKEQFDVEIIRGGEEQLVHTFYKYLSDKEKRLLRIMSFLNSWTEGIMLELLEHMGTHDLIDEYYKVQDMSFVHKDNERFYIHSIVGEIISKQITKSELNIISSCGSVIFTETESMMYEMKKNFFVITEGREFEKYVLMEVLKNLYYLAEQGKVYDVMRYRRIIFEYSKKYNNVDFALAVVDWSCAKAYTTVREINKSLYYSERAYQKVKSNVYISMNASFFDFYVDIKEQYANDLMLCGHNEMSMKIRSEIWSECKRKYGKRSFASMVSEQNYCLSMINNISTQSEGIIRLSKVINKREKSDYGEEYQEQNLQHTINAKITLGEVYADRGEYEKAVKWGREAVITAHSYFYNKEKVEQVRFIHNRYVERIIYSYAEILIGMREFDNAIPLLEELYSSWENLYDENSQIMLSIANCLGIAYSEVGETEKGKKLLLNCYQKSYDTNGKYSRKTLQYKKEYAICIALGGGDEEALELLEDCLFAYKVTYGEDGTEQLDNLEKAVSIQKKKMRLT